MSRHIQYAMRFSRRSPAMVTPNSLLLATADQLARFAPFDSMAREHLLWLALRLKLDYYARGEVVLGPQAGPAEVFYIIKQGAIHGEQDVARAQNSNDWLELHEGECFPLGALLSRRAVASTYRAGQDTFCFELAAADFRELLKRSEAFHDFCTRRLANLLEQSKQVIQAEYAKSSSEQQSMSSTLASLIRGEPVTCAPETPLRQVLGTMHRLGIGSMVAVDAQGKPLGIFTLHDLLHRVVLAGISLDVPFHAVMSPDPETLPPHALAHDAALTMAKRGFRHILVAENGRLQGLISEKDLFSLQRVGLRQISGAIRGADHLDKLKHSANDIRQLAHNMLAQGVATEQSTQIISTLNDLLTRRTIELELRDDPAAGQSFCWLALGAEGRMEQTLGSQQNNGIVFAAREDEDAQAIRAVLLPFAKRVNLALAQYGFPLSPDGAMASHPQWCLSLQEWKHTCTGWVARGDALDQTTVFLDLRPVAGAESLALDLRAWLASATTPRFLGQMATHALRHAPPQGSILDFFAGKGGTLDIERNGSALFVDAARVFSLAAGGGQTTPERLRAGCAALSIGMQDAQAWCDAYLFIQLLRLRLHQEDQGIDPDKLNGLDKRILREAFRQARKLQVRLAQVVRE